MALERSPPSERESIADELVRAHLTGRSVVSSSLPVPLSPASAMQVQALVQERLARPVGGWKVAIGPQQLPIAAPLLDLYPDCSEVSLSQNCTIEVELAVYLRKDLPWREAGSYERSDILDSIENVVLGIEVIGGRFDSAANVPFLSFLADNLGNRAYVIGDNVPLSALSEVNGLDCHVTLDGEPLYQAPASHPAGDPLSPLLAYANAQSDHLGGLKAGQVVTTGSLCGVVPVRAAGLLEARVAQVGQVSVRFGA
ncbi:2-keto-4-pentenoate hydratase [Bradyrhizobium sp. GM7.3]